MGDSDDEYDRRRARDKFRRERSDYTDRRRDRDDRSSRRDDWSDRRREPSWENRRRGDYREFDRGRRDSAGGRHHEMSPPMKRVRRDWDEPSYHNAGDYSVPYGGVPAHHNTWQHPDVQQMQNAQQDARQQQRPDVDQQSQASQGNHAPAMMTFKQFLNAQDDNIGDEEAFNKYQEYKLEFRKTQMSDFFQQHKEEEWFRTKYHPKESAARQKELKKAMKRRLSVFLNLLKSGRADAISLDIDNSDAIVKLLDAVVIKLEGGSDSDLAVLECPPTPPPERRRSSSNPLMSPNGNDPAEPFEEKKDGTVDETAQTSQNDKDAKKDSILETGPVSPSSVPLPSAPPPASAKATAKKEENGDVKMMSVANPTPEQQQLQQQAQQYYHQQQLYYQQQYGYGNYDPQQYPKQVTEEQQQEPQTSQSQKDQGAQKATKKEDEPKKKRKRRHREPYYYDAMDDESESESESDSEPEPAPPGEEMSPVETGKEKELLPPGVEAEAPSIDESLAPPGVDAPKPSEVETSEQLPTSSSNSEKQPSATTDESKPDSGEPAVGSSQPESISGSNGVSQGGKPADVETPVNPQTSDDTAADSTQDPNTKETKQTFPAETSSIEQAESSSSSVAPPEKDSDLVGSTVNGNNTVTAKHQEAEMIPESSSEAQEKPETPVVSSMEAEPSSLTSSAVEPSTQALSSEEKPEQVDSNKVEEAKEDSNKLSEKKEAVEETTPVKEVVKDNKENTTEEKEKDTAEEEPMETDESKQLSTVGEPRALHKTFSLFMRSVPPGISKADIAAMCKRFAGFLRVALSDPSPDRKFFRRGWITFDRSVNIKEICWELNNLRVKDTELSPVVNRDLSRRVRGVSGAATAKQVIRDDIKLAAKLIRELDKRAGIYEKESKEETEAREKAEKEAAEKTEEGEECEAKPADDSDIPDLPNENPILASLSEDATEEEGGEEMELMGTASPTQGESGDKPEVDLSRDSGLLRVLDRLVLYLRVVHSLDYYNGLDYPYEDEMPNRCGIIHVRGATPEKCTVAEVQEWQKGLNQRLEPFWQEKESLKDEEVVKLGKKDPEAETERFVEANTQELAKDKWLCPLSGKKFRGPDFVRKHIFNKHMDKVEAVRMEAEFFNRYLSDPKRPQMPEAPASQRPPGNQMGQMYGQHQHSQGMMGWGPRPQMMMYGPRGPYTPPSYGGYGHEMYGRGHTFPPKPRRFGYGGGGRNKGGDRGFHRDPRTIIQYKDLDAPDDADAF